MSNSTHRVEVFRVQNLDKHPNADRLEIMCVFDSYQAVVKAGDFHPGDLACYVPLDNVLPDAPEYAFLKGRLRIKAAKLRGIVSQGLVLPAPDGAAVGEDVAARLGITHYEPPEQCSQGDREPDPPEPGPKYDLESWFRYSSLIPEGALVEITEKIHGANARFTYQDGWFWAGSRSYFRKESESCIYWRALRQNPWLMWMCERRPGWVVYGEVYGWVQDLRYGAKPGEVHARVFDVWTGTGFLLADLRHELVGNAATVAGLRADSCHAPILHVGAYSPELVQSLLNGQSVIPRAEHLREGIVIKPCREMWSEEIGRVALKAVSPEYLEKS